MKKIFLIISLCIFSTKIKAQIGINTEKPKAALDIASVKSGVILPSLSKTIILLRKENNTGELFFNEKDQCLMLNIAPKEASAPEWVCLGNEPGAIAPPR